MITDPDAVVIGDLNLLRAVGQAGLRSIVVSMSRRTVRSRYCAATFEMTPPLADMERSAGELCALGSSLRTKPTLYYSNDAQLLMVSRHREALSRYFRFLMPDAQLIEDMVDKSRFQELAARRGFPMPRSLLAPVSDSGRVGWPGGFPCVVKPITRVGWFEAKVEEVPHKVFKVESQEELNRKVEAMRAHGRDFILQEFISGEDDQIYSFHGYFDRSSEPLAWFVGRKVRTYPLDTGRSTCLELVREPEVAELGLSTLRGLGFQGVMKADFKRDARTGRLYLLEMNPRFNLWHYLGAVSGVNLPEVAHRYLAGSWSGPPPEYRPGHYWISGPMDLKATWSALRRGRLSAGKWLRSYLGRKVCNVFAWRDPQPFLFAVRTLFSAAIGPAWQGKGKSRKAADHD
jgi:predicted ATP-grasp superfamily ATP-dependent carboligase